MQVVKIFGQLNNSELIRIGRCLQNVWAEISHMFLFFSIGPVIVIELLSKCFFLIGPLVAHNFPTQENKSATTRAHTQSQQLRIRY